MLATLTRARGPAAHAAAAIFVASAAVAACWPLCRQPGLPNAHSVGLHVNRAAGLAEDVRQGALVPRWVDHVNRGLGAPVFVFYGGLAYWPATVAQFLGASTVRALRIDVVLAAVLSGLALLALARSFAPLPWATLAAALYVWLPYRAFDVHNRFALAECFAFAWVPLLFLAARRLVEAPSRRRWLLLVASYGGLTLTHIVSAFMAPFVVGPYVLALAARRRAPARVVPVLTACLVGLAGSAFYLLPALAERGLVHMEEITQDPYARWDRQFLFAEPRYPSKSQVEQAAVAQALVVGAGILVLLARRRRSAADADFEGWLFVGLAAWTTFLSTRASTLVWETVPELTTIQLPYRFLLFQGLAAASVIAWLGRRGDTEDRALDAPAAGRPRMRVIAALTAPPMVAGLVVAAAVPAFARTTDLWRWVEYTYTAERARQPEWATAPDLDYAPLGLREPHALAERALPEWKARLVPRGSAQVALWESQRRVVTTRSDEAGRLELWTFAYAGWGATIDGRPAPLEGVGDLSLISVPVPSGEHRVEIRFGSTPDRRAGVGLSLLGLLLAALGAWRHPGLGASGPQAAPERAAGSD